MKIEVPSINDYEVIDKMAIKLHDVHVEWRPDIFIHSESIFSKKELQEMIDNKNIFVAKLDGVVVGYIIVEIKEKEAVGYKYRKEMNIDAMVVDEKYRGQGIGFSLLDYIKEYAKSLDCTDLRLTVNEENEAAINLYEKFGMRVKNISYTMQIK